MATAELSGLAGDVTAPSDPNIGEMVSIAYGFFPYVLGLVCLVEVVPIMRLRLVLIG